MIWRRKNFLEIGTENYKESNTRFLLINRNWNGFIVEANKFSVKQIKSQKIYWKYNLVVFNKFITRDNVNQIVKNLKIPKKIGLLSLDIDGVDYWVLKNLSELKPSIIICEFNSLFGNIRSVTVPYKANFNRSKEHYSNLYYGASIMAFIKLMKKKNYFFVGTNSAGNNAFFVNKNIWNIIKKQVINNKIFTSKFRESRSKSYKLTFLNKRKSLDLIKNKIVFDLDKKCKKKIRDLNL